MNSTLSIRLSKRRRDHDGSDDFIIRWRHSYLHWYGNPHIREKEPSQGRLLLLNAKLDTQLSSNKRQLKQISDINVKGCVYALARVNGYLAAAIGPAVSFFPSLGSARSGTVTGLRIQS